MNVSDLWKRFYSLSEYGFGETPVKIDFLDIEKIQYNFCDNIFNIETSKKNEQVEEDNFVTNDINEIADTCAMWLVNGEIGESSKALCAVAMSLISNLEIDSSYLSIPYDPSDFRRCVLFLSCFSSDIQHKILMKIASLNTIWNRFAGHWDELMVVYNEERKGKSAPKLYERMKEIINSKD